MNPDKILCFELFGDYAQFKKFFANMSPLSFSIPPRTVLTGIIGAILGIDKQINPETFNESNSFIALRLLSPVKKTKITHNYIKTNTSLNQVYDFKEHKPTNIEFLKDVRYRIYFSCSEQDTYNKLKELLVSHCSYYTVSLGISGCLANFEFLGEFEVVANPSELRQKVNTVIPFVSIQEIFLEETLNLQKVVIPAFMNNQREVLKYEEILFEQNGAPIDVIVKDSTYLVRELQDVIHGF
ncbi:MAG: type I-B CRISPR-associated protein Cas5b [Candidatus Cloacimonas acidaminovorans]|nr:type I-B CRISPR-associated protein Cas5b [Candidatus Cloacimonas acidaminovorans]